MPNTQNAISSHEYRSVPITVLVESASNPRKRFDEKSIEELAARFKTQGVLAPLLVRELEQSKYEVVGWSTPLLDCGGVRLHSAFYIELEPDPSVEPRSPSKNAVAVTHQVQIIHLLRST